jgi:hypothetical protein
MFFVLFHQSITVYKCLPMDASLKIHALLVSVTWTRLTTSWVEDSLLTTLTIQTRSTNPLPLSLLFLIGQLFKFYTPSYTH